MVMNRVPDILGRRFFQITEGIFHQKYRRIIDDVGMTAEMKTIKMARIVPSQSKFQPLQTPRFFHHQLNRLGSGCT